jgi:hypothetical protein
MDFPTINEIDSIGRLDTNLYRKEFKETDFLIKNYSKGFNTIYDLGFTLSRGQNLQVSNIGTSIYSKTYFPNFYTLMLPKFLSKYGTIDTVEYIGNPKELKTLKKGDLIFGAEGFEKGRSIIIIEDKEKTITNTSQHTHTPIEYQPEQHKQKHTNETTETIIHQSITKYLGGKQGKTFSVYTSPEGNFFKLQKETATTAEFVFEGNEAEAIAKRVFSDDICNIISGSYQNAQSVKTLKSGTLEKDDDKWKVKDKIEIKFI